MRQRIASDTTFADFKWNDQIDDFIVLHFSNIYYNIYTDYPYNIWPSKYNYFFAKLKITTYNSNFFKPYEK